MNKETVAKAAQSIALNAQSADAEIMQAAEHIQKACKYWAKHGGTLVSAFRKTRSFSETDRMCRERFVQLVRYAGKITQKGAGR